MTAKQKKNAVLLGLSVALFALVYRKAMKDAETGLGELLTQAPS